MSKQKVTKHKFYNKWFYKITLNVQGIGILRTRSSNDILNFFQEAKKQHNNRINHISTFRKALNNEETITEICLFLNDIKNVEWNKRIEGNSVDFYTNDESLYQQFCNKFYNIVTHHFEPDPYTLDLFKNQYTIVANKYIHNKYKFKVYLCPHKLKKDIDAKSSFLGWIDNQKDKILISEVVKTWFINTEWNWDRRYILVDNEQTLLMLKMRNSDVVGKVYEYVISDK